MSIIYPAIISHEYDRYNVEFPDLPEAITEGESLEEAIFNAAEVLTLTLEGRMEEGAAIGQKLIISLEPVSRKKPA